MVVDLSQPINTEDISELDLDIMYKRLQIIELEMGLIIMRNNIEQE